MSNFFLERHFISCLAILSPANFRRKASQMQKCKRAVWASLFFIAFASAMPATAEIINGGFETAPLGDVSGNAVEGWTLSSNDTMNCIATIYHNNGATEGSNYIYLGAASFANGSFTTELKTDANFYATPGSTISFDYRAYGDAGDYYSSRSTSITLTTAHGDSKLELPINNEWTRFSMVVPADAEATSLKFTAYAGSAQGKYGSGWSSATIDLDNVQIIDAIEPSSLLLLTVGSLSLVSTAWGKRRKKLG
jgi:hypothetical protein